MVYRQSGQSDRTVRFLELADKVKYEIQREIEAHKRGKGNDGDVNQLNKIMKEVENMTITLSPKKYTPTYPRMIVDSWDYTSNLAVLLLDFNESYSKLK